MGPIVILHLQGIITKGMLFEHAWAPRYSKMLPEFIKNCDVYLFAGGGFFCSM